MVVLNLQRGGRSLEVRGLNARADLLTSDRFAAGPAFGVRMSRDNDVKGRVALLNKVDTAIEVGAFAGFRFGGDARGHGQWSIDLTALADAAGAHDGFVASLSVDYAAVRTRRFWVNLDAEASYGDRSYQRTYFGVTAPEAAMSGLAVYRPKGSLLDAGVGMTAGFQLNERWGLLGRASYSRLLGDAADSPIVRQEGSRNQGLVGVAVSYRF